MSSVFPLLRMLLLQKELLILSFFVALIVRTRIGMLTMFSVIWRSSNISRLGPLFLWSHNIFSRPCVRFDMVNKGNILPPKICFRSIPDNIQVSCIYILFKKSVNNSVTGSESRSKDNQKGFSFQEDCLGWAGMESSTQNGEWSEILLVPYWDMLNNRSTALFPRPRSILDHTAYTI